MKKPRKLKPPMPSRPQVHIYKRWTSMEDVEDFLEELAEYEAAQPTWEQKLQSMADEISNHPIYGKAMREEVDAIFAEKPKEK